MNDRLLRRALSANAAFSAGSGVAALAAAPALADDLGVHAAVLLVLGVGLLGYAGLLGSFTRRAPIRRDHAWAAIVADGAWVAGAVALLAAWPDVLSSAGRWTLGLLTVVVADAALAQWLGVRRLDAATAGQP